MYCPDCKCNSCANNVDNLETDGEQIEVFCYNCDMCMVIKLCFKCECDNHKITKAAAERFRKKNYKGLVVVAGGGGGSG